MVFDDVERGDASPAAYSETTFRFLDRVAGPFWERVRNLIEDWFSRLCDDARDDIRARLRSEDNRQFRAAFWELYCHETLLRLGFRVACHPAVITGQRRPDFLAETDDARFVLEATVAGEADAEMAARRREAEVFDAINRLDSPNFSLFLEVQRTGATAPSTARLRRQLANWLRDLDPQHLKDIAASENFLLSPRTPTWLWEDSGWRIKFLPLPKSPGARADPGFRPIGMHGHGVHFVDDAAPIRRAVTDKANAYGRLDVPFIIAVEADPIASLDDIDVRNALLGREQVTLMRDQDGDVSSTMTRARDGAWVGPHGTQNTRVSAVLIAANVGPWRIPQVVPTLWHHPAATHPVVVRRAPWRQVTMDTSASTTSSEPPLVPASAFFGLDAGWPGPEPPFPP